MQNIIKWKKLARIIKSITDKEINIILTTGIENTNIIAATDHVENIFLNGNIVKNIDMVIKSIAHEVVHIIDKSIKEHTVLFSNKTKEIENLIKNNYY